MNKRHYEHTLPNIRGSLSNTYKRFWLSEFSHLGGSRNPTGSNLVSVTEKARANPFDENELKPMNKQLKDLLA